MKAPANDVCCSDNQLFFLENKFDNEHHISDRDVSITVDISILNVEV